MMKRPKPIGTEAKASLYRRLKASEGTRAYQRVLCVWLRAELGLDSEAISRALGWNPSYVRQIQAQYLRQGEDALQLAGRGGRYHQNLTVEEEQALLAPFLREAERGGVLVVTAIQTAYEARVGRKVPKSTVYRMLERHGWRKITPRPHHPKADPAAQAAFKKTSPRS
jgi:transposase